MAKVCLHDSTHLFGTFSRHGNPRRQRWAAHQRMRHQAPLPPCIPGKVRHDPLQRRCKEGGGSSGGERRQLAAASAAASRHTGRVSVCTAAAQANAERSLSQRLHGCRLPYLQQQLSNTSAQKSTAQRSCKLIARCNRGDHFCGVRTQVDLCAECVQAGGLIQKTFSREGPEAEPPSRPGTARTSHVVAHSAAWQHHC